MVDTVSESDITEQDAETIETKFLELQQGEEISVSAWGGGDRYVKVDSKVQYTSHSTSSDDDIVQLENGVSLRLPWNPKEPAVGIDRPYPEFPILLEEGGKSYDVVSIN